MSQWYLSKNGQAVGPLTEEALSAMIDGGEIGHLDLVYKAGDSEWKPLGETLDFKHKLNAAPPIHPPVDEAAVEWVLLKQVKSEKGKEYRQLGPFSKQQVLDLIDQGEVRFSDFCWRKGLDSWIKIVDQSEFASPLASSAKVDADLYTISSFNGAPSEEESVDISELTLVESFSHESEPGKPQLNSTVFDSNKAATEASVNFGNVHVDNATSIDQLQMLEPPHPDMPMDDERTVYAPSTSTTKVREPDENVESLSDGDSSDINISKISNADRLQWLAAFSVLALAVFFLYVSFSPDTEDVSLADPTDIQDSEQSGVRRIQRPLKVAKTQVEQVNLHQQPQEPKPSVTAAPVDAKAIEPKVPAKEAAVVAAPKAKPIAKAAPKKRSKVQIKKKSVAKPVARKKAKGSSKAGRLATGSMRDRSYYLQRDRKALFYSSVKAETLTVEINRQFRKIGKNKKAWKRYYTQWKKKVRISLAKEIRAFPEKNQRYGYPRQMASFKKDYAKIYPYGEVFNSKVLGLRRPSGAPSNLGVLFARHKKLAQGLGQ